MKLDKKPLVDILHAYTQIVCSICSCQTLDQLSNCEPLISNFNTFNDHSNKHVWTNKALEVYKKQHEKLNAHNVKTVDTDEPEIFMTDAFKKSVNTISFYATIAELEAKRGNTRRDELDAIWEGIVKEVTANSEAFSVIPRINVVPDIDFCSDVHRVRSEELDDRAREMAATDYPDFVEHH